VLRTTQKKKNGKNRLAIFTIFLLRRADVSIGKSVFCKLANGRLAKN